MSAGDLVVVFGGSGFIGKQVVRALGKSGYRVRIAMRRPHLGAELRVMGDVGQVQLVQANVRFPQSIDAALEDADAVVNLVSTMYEGGNQNFETLNVEAAQSIAEAAAKRGITRIVQMSALGAAPKGARYARSKYRGERAVLAAAPTATILRPSVVFGPEDTFFNRFAEMARNPFLHGMGGTMPLIGGGKTKMQPIFVGDVADAVVAAISKREAQGRTYELGGPRTYTFKQLLQYVCDETDRHPIMLPLASVIAHPIGLITNWVFGLLPWNPPLTGDQVTMLKRDNIVGADSSAHTIQDLGVTSLESIEAIVPSYLWRFRPYGQFQTKQNAA
ncbi:MAG: complex I NDUFA9 subunit family protein [Terricaulis sp.]